MTNATNGHTSTAERDIRDYSPIHGLKEYWYPAMEAKKVKNKPMGLDLLGVDLVLFRGKGGEVAALWNVCPHRGGSLMHGDCHFEGTVSCPYHGWTFDGDGNVLAVLPEGPESKIPGKVKARKYPTVTLKGMVWVWMGEGNPAPLEEDIPPEFFDDRSMMQYATEYWPVNWLLAMDNGPDAHVPYVHRNAARSYMFPVPATGPVGLRNYVVNGRAIIARRSPNSRTPSKPFARVYFPVLNGYWPKHNWRALWTWMFLPLRRRAAKMHQWDTPEEWGGGHHLPAMFRSDHKTDLYTRFSVPVNETRSRQVYFKAVRPNSWLGRLYERTHFKLYGRWMQVTNFSMQDAGAIGQQTYSVPEFLSATDSHQVLWRRLLMQARGMMPPEEAQSVPETTAELISFARQEEQGLEPESILSVGKESTRSTPVESSL